MIAPFDHPWHGGLFGDAEASAIWAPARQMTHMLAFEAAFSRALGEVGIIPKEVAEQVASQITAHAPDWDDLRAGMAQDGLIVPRLVAQLRAQIPLHPPNPKAIHSGATSQDLLDSALALTLQEFNALLETRLQALDSALDDLAARFGEAPLMGRTRMQAALPIKVRDRLRAWQTPLQNAQRNLRRMRPEIERLQLGGPVGTRASLAPHGDAIAADMAARLNLRDPGNAWHTTRDHIVEYGGLLSLISGALGKMGQDICLMAQQGLDEIALTNGGSSSAMAHKNNPILAELLVSLAAFNATQISGLHTALRHEQERSGAAWALEWMILPQMALSTARGLSAAQQICAEVTRIG